MPENPEKKIIIDEDWKAQAQAEKEKLAKKIEKGKAAQAAGGEKKTPAADKAAFQWPKPTLQLLVTTLATQAMVALGIVEHPASGKPEPDPAQAKHFIDTIEMLTEKTQGNRTPEESEMIEAVLYQLRMAYVAVNKC